MNTFNLITAIALLACILTPAYVLYFLKHQLFANQKKHKETIDIISKDLSKLHYEVEKIQFDEIEHRLERNKQLLELTDKIDSSNMKHSMSQNNIDNINVTIDYLRRTLAEYLKKTKDDLKKKEEEIKQTKPTESVVSEVVNIIKDQEETLVEGQGEGEGESSEEKRIRKPKAESKRVIRSRELEKYFKEQTKLTYRGFVIKFGEEAFKRERNLVYKRLYYQKFTRPLLITQDDYVQSQLAFNKIEK